MKLIGLTAIALLAAATIVCAADKIAGKRAQYSGYFATGFELSLFRPNGVSESWWLSGKLECPSGSAPPKSPDGASDVPAQFIVVIGVATVTGSHGHLGNYDRELKVEQTLSCRPLTAKEARSFRVTYGEVD